MQCPIESLVAGRYQPRREFDEQALAELTASIQTQGLLQPLVVREITVGQYEIMAGERRWRASKMAGLARIPVIVRQVDDETALALALIENLQREDLSVVEQAYAMQRLFKEFQLTHQHIATLLSTSRASVSNHLRLLNLNPDVLAMLERGQLDMGHARCLLTLTAAMQAKVAKEVVSKELSVRQAEALVARVKAGASTASRTAVPYPSQVQEKLVAVTSHLQTAVKLKSDESGRGTIVIHYPDWSSLEQILTQILE
jgi:ParB family chromosome partitioning protein